MKVLTPPNYVNIDRPVLFLAGPIKGAVDWQSEAIKIVSQAELDIYIANPQRANFHDPGFVYNEQVDWETYHLRKAGLPEDKDKKGVIMFWFAKEHEHNCERPYAQTTGKEYGEWKAYHMLLGANIAMGIEKGSGGERYTRRRMMQDCPDVKIYHTLEETCDEAVRLMRKNR